MTLDEFIVSMPKVELHVHLEGSTSPEALLELAQRHDIELPASTVEGIQAWYTSFDDFPGFLSVIRTMVQSIRTPDDIELITHQFLAGQAAQNILYTEATYTASTHYKKKGIPFREQLDAINRARAWAEAELGVALGIVIDIPRDNTLEDSLMIADWAISGMGDGVVALGLAGMEVGNPPEKFAAAFERAREAGLPGVPHAGELVGPESIWGALNALHATRIGHGIRCLEDPALVDELRARQTPLEVCPTSNVCMGIVPSLADHPFPKLIAEGLCVTLNTDNPPLLDTTLTGEYLAVAHTFQLGADDLEQLVLNAVRATLLPERAKADMEELFVAQFGRLRAETLD